MRTRSRASPRIGMKSMSRTVPSSVSNSVSTPWCRRGTGVASLGLGWLARSTSDRVPRCQAKQRKSRRSQTGYAQPVDRPVAADQGRRLGVADDRVILNGQSQGDLSGRNHHTRFARWRISPTEQNEHLLPAPVNARIAVSSSCSIDYPPTQSSRHHVGPRTPPRDAAWSRVPGCCWSTMPPGGSASGHDHAPGAAEQVARDRRQQVVLAKLGDVEQGHDVQPACGPNAWATATPRFSSTTGRG